MVVNDSALFVRAADGAMRVATDDEIIAAARGKQPANTG